MMTKALLAFSLLLAALPCRALNSFYGTELELSPSAVPAAAPAAVTAPSAPGQSSYLPLPQKDYTVMLFMNGKNNLGAMMARKLVELEKLGSDANVNFVMELGLKKLKPSCDANSTACRYPYNADWEGVRRYYVLKNANASSNAISSSLRLPDPDNQDMGDYRSLVAFVQWAKRNFPARKYILVVGNHGGAWVDKKKPKADDAKGVSYDDLTRNYITTPEIGAALRETGGADILIFDDCLMQAAEVAAEAGTSVKFIVGSEEVSYTSHFRPALFFAPLKAQPAMTAAVFMDRYSGLAAAHMTKLWNDTGKFPGTVSILDTSRTAVFQGLVKQYAAAARELLRGSPVALAAYRAAMTDVIRYHYKYCVDLYDFLELAQEKVAATPLASTEKALQVDRLADELKRHIAGGLVPYNFAIGNAAGKDYSRSHGLTVYVPIIKAGGTPEAQPTFLVAPGTLQTKYADLAFDKATSWSLFVKDLSARQP